MQINTTASPAVGGTVTPSGLFGMGQPATLVASRAAGYSFSGWMENNTTVSNAAHYTFVVAGTRSLTAGFIPGPFTSSTGTYSGLVQSSGAPIGFTSIAVSPTGAASLALTFNGKRYSLRENFALDGSFSGNIKDTAYQVILQLDLTGGSGTITGTITDESNVSSTPLTLQADLPSAASGVTRGHYTMLLRPPAPGDNQPTSSFPQGIGYAQVSVSSHGAVRVVSGKLGNGTTFTQAGGISKNGTWPFFVPLKAGYLAGLITFANQTTSDFSGTITWNQSASKSAYPAGFSIQAQATGAHYLSQLRFTGGTITFGAGGLNPAPAPEAVTFTLSRTSGAYKSPELTMKVSLENGAFSGKFTPAGGKPMAFAGVMLQKGNGGGGLFVGAGGQTGFVQFQNSP